MDILEIYKAWKNGAFRSKKCGNKHDIFTDKERRRIEQEVTKNRKDKRVSYGYAVVLTQIVNEIQSFPYFECEIKHKLTKQERELLIEYIKKNHRFSRFE